MVIVANAVLDVNNILPLHRNKEYVKKEPLQFHFLAELQQLLFAAEKNSLLSIQVTSDWQCIDYHKEYQIKT